MKPELRQFIETTKDLGHSKEERRGVLQKFEGRREGASEELKRVLTPENVADFLKSVSGQKGGEKSLVRLGHVLYDFFDKAKPDVQLNKNDLELLSMAVEMIERAFYAGNLIDLDAKDAAAMAFLVNRLAKIKADEKYLGDITNFDREKFVGFIKEVSDFAENFIVANKSAPAVDRVGRDFMVSRRRLENDLNKRYFGFDMYLIKSFLIAADMIKEGEGLLEPVPKEWWSPPAGSSDSRLVYDFSYEPNQKKGAKRRGFDSFHFVPEHITFLKFAAEYLKKKKEQAKVDSLS